MKFARAIIGLLIFAFSLRTRAQEPWQSALAKMPLVTNVAELNRTNCVDITLRSFQSNDVVKALVFMPGATDEFYLFRRARASLTNGSPTLLDAIAALTNQTFIRATFRAPLLLLHTDEDPADPISVIKNPATAARIRETPFASHGIYNDRDWDFLLPVLKKSYGITFAPKLYSRNSFHFYRHSFAEWNLDGWEALEAIALAGKTRFTVDRKRVTFEGDNRIKVPPVLDGYPEYRK
jgi:hypothetical protein